MSLSKAIIYNNYEEVQRLLLAGVDVDHIDEYGYRPLIQSAIVNNIDMTKKLLEYGADAKAPDLTGGTALHWAVDNNNIALSRLLLQHGADPNAFNEYGESVAVKPILRRQSSLRALLYEYGMDFNFANDFIHTKLLGHRFELRGYADIVNAKNQFVQIDLEGFFLEFTLEVIYQSLFDFHKHFFSKHLATYLPAVQQLLEVFQRARQLIKYEHYLIDVDNVRDRIDSLLNYPITLIPVSYEGHAIAFIKCGNLLGLCDRAQNESFKENVMIYGIGKPVVFNAAFTRHLMYNRQSRQFINDDLPRLLALTEALELPLAQQITGNCSWANIEASIPVTLFFSLLFQEISESAKINNLQQKKNSNVDHYQKFALFFYQQWREWDKDRALSYLIQEFANASPARKAAIAALLGAVLFQRCSVDIDRDLTRAHKIVSLLKSSNYDYILKSYIEIYCHQYPSEAGKNLQRLLARLENW